MPVGCALCLLGFLMLTWSLFIGPLYVSLCGWLILLSGSITSLSALFSRDRDLFWLNLFRGALYTVLGFMFVSRPAEARDAIGMLASAVLLVEGIFEIAPFAVLGFSGRVPRTILGVYCIVMGIMIWAAPSEAGLRLISAVLAIGIVLHGITFCYVGVAGRLPKHGDWSAMLGNTGKLSTQQTDATDSRPESEDRSLE